MQNNTDGLVQNCSIFIANAEARIFDENIVNKTAAECADALVTQGAKASAAITVLPTLSHQK